MRPSTATPTVASTRAPARRSPWSNGAWTPSPAPRPVNAPPVRSITSTSQPARSSMQPMNSPPSEPPTISARGI
jgi:hypothetical protein